MKRLVLVDGNALFHRAFHATPPLTTSKGELINAVFGFTNMFLKTWDDLKPDFLAIAWDKAAPTFRHKEYTQYKATRKPLDEALGSQYGRVHEVIDALGVPEFSLDGYEADDVIGTLAKQAGKKGGIEVIVLTGDRDIMQIINGYVKILMPKKTLLDVGLYGEKEFIEKYSFKPVQIIDFKALAGDASDNIPGVAGIGAVTATKLINQFGSVEKIYLPENLKTLPERMRLLLSEGAESAVLSKKLATLDLSLCAVKDYKREEVAKVFEELEFKSLLNKITGKGKDPLKGGNQLGLNAPSVSNGQNKQTSDLDLAVSKVLEKMSKTGILVDLKFLEKLGKELKSRLEYLQSEIFKTVGHEFNLNSPKQLSEVLFDDLKLPVYKKTKTGRSTDEETLNELSAAHPMIPLFLEYRQLFKLISTYIDALPKSVGEDGRIHSTFNVEGAATGRLSSTNPNLQNIPVGEVGGKIRKAFIAPQGKIFLGADYSQIELRILAHLSEDENLIKAFKEGLDIHSATASKIFDVPLDEVTRQQRMVGKTMNFATLYGQGPRALSKQLKIDYATAKNYIDDYFMQFPKVRIWMAKVLEEGMKNGFVQTLGGRKRYIPELASQNRMIQSFGERAAINHPVQGSAADMIKKAMVEIDRELGKREKGKGKREENSSLITSEAVHCPLILQVHDELLFECDPDFVEEAAKMIKEKMEHALELSVPVKVDLKSGVNWGEMSPLKV
ncbi:hypothetical protein HYW44_02805 [Candidatus Daviesbacteria bacterium]|nr:hypothetical protein [Candidatus Daviesbacteria bacterium]